MHISHSTVRIRFRRMMPLILCLLLILYAVPVAAQSAGGPGSAGIHPPIVEPDPETPTGIKTTWSCVLFGTYPSAEVVDSAWDEVDDYALQDGDLIRDDGLYARLEAADWQDNRAYDSCGGSVFRSRINGWIK